MDGLAEDIQKLQPAVDLWRKFIYCTSLSGSILGSVDHMQPQGSLAMYVAYLCEKPDFFLLVVK